MKEWHTCLDSKQKKFFCAARQMEIKKNLLFEISFFFHVFWEWNIFEKKKKI